MISVTALQQEIIYHPEHIITVLENLGHEGIKDRGTYIQFKNIDGDNESGCSILKSTLQYQNWSHNVTGNIFTLVQDDLKYGFKQALDYVAKCIGFTKQTNTQIIRPFGGFYKNIIPANSNEIIIPKDYSDDILKQYNGLSQKFYNDGISLPTQEFYEIGFSHEDNAISIPVRDLYGRLVGVKMRNNDDNEDNRYWASYEYPKSSVIYGGYQNYRSILNKKTCIVVEAEKSVMVLDSFGCYVGVAIGGHNISKSQAKLIKSLMCDKIIVAFDESIPQDEIEFEASKLKMNNMVMENKVSYLYDKDHDYLKIGSKDAPVDIGRKKFIGMLKDCKYEVK